MESIIQIINNNWHWAGPGLLLVTIIAAGITFMRMFEEKGGS